LLLKGEQTFVSWPELKQDFFGYDFNLPGVLPIFHKPCGHSKSRPFSRLTFPYTYSEMSHNLAEGIIRLFGLYFLFNAIIGGFRIFIAFFQGHSMFNSEFLQFQSTVSTGVAWGLAQVAISIAGGVLILKQSEFLANVVVPNDQS
jgi:hypothetical protein